MRSPVSLLLVLPLVLLVGCAEEAAPLPQAPPPLPASPAPAPPPPAAADPVAAALRAPDAAAALALRQQPGEAARRLLSEHAGGDAIACGRAAALLADLGERALPELGAALRLGSAAERRLAALACLRLGASARPLLSSLLAARDDADDGVRAAAELAFAAAIGDRSDLDLQRAADAAAGGL